MTASLTGFASPALARTCGTLTIEDGTVSPGTGTPSTTFTFAVTVSDTSRDCADLGPGPRPGHVVRPGSDRIGLDRRCGLHGYPQPPGRIVGLHLPSEKQWGQLRSHAGRSIAGRRQRPATADSDAGADTHAPTPTPTPKPTPKPTAKPTAEADGRADAETRHAEADRQADQEAGRQADRKADGQTHPQARQGDGDATRHRRGRDTEPAWVDPDRHRRHRFASSGRRRDRRKRRVVGRPRERRRVVGRRADVRVACPDRRRVQHVPAGRPPAST